ncbi:MAG: DcaP family trimeric outer membrane transporter [Pelobium sp.]
MIKKIFTILCCCISFTLQAQETPRVPSLKDSALFSADSLKIKQIRHPQSPKPKYQKFAFSGYLKLKSTFDFGPNLANTSEFITSSIPTGLDMIQEKTRLSFDARESRIAFDGNFKEGNQLIHTYVEADFYASEELAIRYLNLRLAYIDIWKFHIGRDWSTFVNLEAIPLQVDFEGPNSLPGPKNEMIRFVHDINKRTVLNVAVETHASDYTSILNDDPRYTSVPDLVSNITFSRNWGQFSMATVIRDISYLNTLEDTKHLFGMGANVAGLINLYPSANNTQKDNLMFMAVAGKGISYYIDDLSGAGLDAFPLSKNSLSALRAGGGYIAFQHYWTKNMSSTALGSYLALENDPRLDQGVFKSSLYLSGNLIITPIKNFMVGVTFLYGKYTVQSSAKGHASRIQSMFMYSF